MQSSGPCCQSDAILQARKPLFLHNDVYDVARHLLAAGWSRRAPPEIAKGWARFDLQAWGA
jgi:hypothetical protein